jgi:hypothetical protein
LRLETGQPGGSFRLREMATNGSLHLIDTGKKRISRREKR